VQKLDGTYFNTDSYQLVSRGPNGVQDGDVTLSDFSYYLSLWSNQAPSADLTTEGSSNGTPDGMVSLSDFSFYLALWSAGGCD